LEDATVVRLEPHTAQRAGESELRQIARRTLQRVQERTARDHLPGAGEIQPLGAGAERALDEPARVARFLGKDRQYVGGKPGALQRVEPFLRPRDVLKNADGEK